MELNTVHISHNTFQLLQVHIIHHFKTVPKFGQVVNLDFHECNIEIRKFLSILKGFSDEKFWYSF